MGTDETSEQGNLPENPEPGHRRPYWVVGLALLGLVVVLLAGAFLLERQSRPRVGGEPPSAVTGTTSAQAAAGDVQPTAQSAAAPPETAKSASPTPIETVGGLRVANSPLEREIEAAYENYLRVYREAVLNLDTSHLNEVLAGQALQSVTDEVDGIIAGGRPVKIIEDQRLVSLGRVTETRATVVDEYVSRSVYVDPSTKQPLPRTGPPTRVRQSYELRKISGVWKIVDGTRETLGEVNR